MRLNRRFLFIAVIIAMAGYAVFGDHAIHRPVPEARVLFMGDERLLEPPLSPAPLGVLVGPADPATIIIPFSEPVHVSGFSFFCAGNMHAVSSYSPRSFEIWYKDHTDEWVSVAREHRHAESTYHLQLSENVTTTAFRVVVYIAPEASTAVFGDLTFYERIDVPWYVALADAAYRHRRGPAAYLFYSFLFYALLLIPGVGYTQSFLKKKGGAWPASLLVVCGPLVMLCMLILVAFLGVVTQVMGVLLAWLPLALYGCWLFWRHVSWQMLRAAWRWVTLVAVVLVAINLLQLQRDYMFNLHYIEPYLETLPFIPIHGGYFGYHADNTLQWGIARTLLHQVPIFSEAADALRLGFNGRAMFDRTPFLPLASMPIIQFFGEGHFIYQRWLNVLMALYYPAMVFLVNRLVSKKAALITAVLLVLSPHITYQTFLVEVYIKYVALYPLLLGLIIALVKDIPLRARHFSAGLLGVIAYLIHPIVLLFLAPLGVIYLVRYRLSRDFWRRALPVFVPVVIAFVSWSLFSSWFLAAHQPPDLPQQPSLYLRQLATVTNETLTNKVINIGNIFVPDILARKAEYDTLFSGTYFRHQFVRYSMIMAVSPLILLLFLRSLTDRVFRVHYRDVLLMALIPLALFLVLFHTYSFGAYSLLYPFVVPLIWGLAVTYAERFAGWVRVVGIASFPLWMIPTLQYVSEVTPSLEVESHIVKVSSYAVIALFILLGLVLLRVVWRSTTEAEDTLPAKSP